MYRLARVFAAGIHEVQMYMKAQVKVKISSGAWYIGLDICTLVNVKAPDVASTSWWWQFFGVA